MKGVKSWEEKLSRSRCEALWRDVRQQLLTSEKAPFSSIRASHTKSKSTQVKSKSTQVKPKSTQVTQRHKKTIKALRGGSE